MGRCAAAIPQGILFFGVVFVSGPKILGKPGSFLRASYDRPAADEKRALAISTANSKSRHCGEHQNPGGIVRELASARSLTEELVEAGADVGIDLGGGSLGSSSHKRDRN